MFGLGKKDVNLAQMMIDADCVAKEREIKRRKEGKIGPSVGELSSFAVNQIKEIVREVIREELNKAK